MNSQALGMTLSVCPGPKVLELQQRMSLGPSKGGVI